MCTGFSQINQFTQRDCVTSTDAKYTLCQTITRTTLRGQCTYRKGILVVKYDDLIFEKILLEISTS